MTNIEALYNDSFFKGRHKYAWRAPIVCTSVVKIMEHMYGEAPKSAMDLGCAIGDLVQGFLDLGLEAWGVEGSEAAQPYLACPEERVIFHDLRKPMAPYDFAPVDVLTCFEVAEHLEEKYADQFVDTLCALSDHLVISACPPDPNGRPPTKYHDNEKPASYWIEKFQQRGFRRNTDVEALFKQAWHPWRKRYGIAAFHQNLIYFERA